MSLDNPFSVEAQLNKPKVSPTSRIPNQLNHGNQASGNRRKCRLRRRSPQRLTEITGQTLP
jgi:hypothetical protein